jgi:hypothetical protein
MSGGSFDYGYAKFWNDYSGKMEDDIMEEIINDLSKVLKDLEWYKSCDIGKEDYFEAVKNFKAKWIGKKLLLLEEDQINNKIDKLIAELENLKQ